MMQPKLILASCALLLMGYAGASAQVSRPYMVVASGRPIEVAKYAAINPDCSPMGPTTVNLIEAAHNGELKVGEGLRFMAYGVGNPRAACNRRKIRTTYVTYQSEPGFVGQDSFVIEAIFSNGTAQKARLTVDVR